jgi:hypothetical protein
MDKFIITDNVTAPTSPTIAIKDVEKLIALTS